MHVWELHPAIVHFPIAFLTAGVVLDLCATRQRRLETFRWAAGLFAAGFWTMVPVALAGLLAFFTVPAYTREARALMYWHLGLNAVALVLWAWIARVRWRERAAVPSGLVVVLGALLLAVTLFAAGIGGEMVYQGGAGIDPAILSEEVKGTPRAT